MEEQKTKFVSFNFKLKLSYFAFLLPFLFIVMRYCRDEVFHRCKPSENLLTLKYNLPHLFYSFLPKIFSFIFILIVKFNTKRETSSSNKKLVVKNYHIATEKRNKKKSLILIYIISLLEALHEDLSSILYYFEIYVPKKGHKKPIKGWLIERKSCFIIFVPIFAYLILHTEIHRHHYLAFLFGYFGCIFVNATRFFTDFSYIEDYPFHLFNVFISSIHSLSLVLVKYIMIKYVLLSPYFFLFYDGIFNIFNSTLLILLQYPIIINLPDHNKNIDNISDENDKYFYNNFVRIIKILIGQTNAFYKYFFLAFIFSFFYYILYTLVIFNNSPFLIILIEAFLPLDSDIIKIILHEKNIDYIDKDKSWERFGFQTIGYLFLLFGALILNEIIIFNRWGLNRFTIANLKIRAESDINDNSVLELNDTTAIGDDTDD